MTSFGIERTGGWRAVFEVANRLHDLNYDVTITTLYGNPSWFPLKVKVNCVASVPDRRLARGFDRVAGTYRRLRGRYAESSIFYLSRLLRMGFGAELDLMPYLSENIPDCDVNVATWYPTAFAVYFSGKGRPYYFLQDSSAMVAEQCFYRGEYCLRMFETTLRLPFHFLANSSYTRDLILESQPGAQITKIGVGIETTIFHPSGKKLFDDLKKPIVMVILGGFKFKGDETAIRVLNGICEKIPLHGILVASEKSFREVFDSGKPKFTYTRFPPVNQEELATLYSSADLFLYTSYLESFGLPPLEAMACGTPVVTTDCLGNRDYAIDGYNCLLVPPGDIEGLTQASLRVLSDSKVAQQLRAGGLETAKKFTWDKVVQRVDDALNGSEGYQR